MFKMNTTGTMRILKLMQQGKSKDGSTWAFFAAISNEEKLEEKVDDKEYKSDFYVIKAFGTMADYMIRNITAPRRAMVSGELRIETYVKETVVVQQVEIDGNTYDIELKVPVEERRPVIFNPSIVTFLDSKPEAKEKNSKDVKATTVTITPSASADNTKTKAKASKSKSNKSTATAPAFTEVTDDIDFD